MRSRFAAFALGDVEYLWRTLHPEHEERAANKTEFVRAVTATCRALKFMRLTILEARGDRVLFLAGVFEKGRDRSFVELSTFAREGEGGPWRYRSGEARSPVDARQAHQWTIDSFEAGGAGGPGLGVG
jgi:SEC-C motif-containing protein